MSDLILRQGDIDRFTSTLGKLVENAGISLSVLIHRDGHLLASAGDTELLDATALSALISASFSSMIAVANLLGEQEFRTQHLAGKEKSIYISLADEYTFVVSVFDVGTPLQPLRSETEKHREELAKALTRLYNNEPEPLPDEEEEEEEEAQGEREPAAEEEILDAEEAARREKATGKAAGKAAPRRLSYTGTGKQKTDESLKKEERRRIKEPDAGDADLEALANAISLRKDREKAPAEKPAPSKSEKKDDAESFTIDGKKMNVVSLKAKSGSAKKKSKK